MSNRPHRNYRILDSEVISQGQKILKDLIRHRVDFQRMFGAVLTDAWFDRLYALLEKISTMPSDIAMRGHQAMQTEILNSFYEQFKPLHKQILIAVGFAFPDDAVIQAEFGQNRKKEVTGTEDSFYTFLTDFASFWTMHRAALIANSCPATMGDDIAALKKAYSDCKTQQGTAMDERHSATLERIANFKEFWLMLNKLEECADSLYEKDPATLALYTLYRGPSAKGDEEVVPPSAH